MEHGGMEHILALSVNYSVHEGKKIVSAVSGLFLKLICHGAGTVVHLLLLKADAEKLSHSQTWHSTQRIVRLQFGFLELNQTGK